MKLLNKTVLAATIAMLVSPAAFAGQIQEGTTGYASKIVNGQEIVLGQTYKIGQDSLPVIKQVSIPESFSKLNQDSVGPASLDSQVLIASKKGDVVTIDYLGRPANGTVLSNTTESNGDKTIVTDNGNKDRSVLTFGSNGSVVGSASVDGHSYDISTDANGNSWMVDNTTSGQVHAGLENDIKVSFPLLGGSVSTVPVAPVVPIKVTATSTVPNVQLLVYVSTSIPNGATVVNNLVASTNQAFIDSDVKMKVTAVKVVSVVDQYPTNETSSLITLRAGTNSFPTLKADLLSTKADLVTFIHPFKVAQAMCGLATLNGGFGQAFSKNNVYSVVSYGADGTSYCNNWTLAHELGHTMGMVHDKAHSIGVTGHFADSFGYGLVGAYGDLMSYFPANGVFSTPNKYWNNKTSFPYGVIDKENVARGLNEIATEVTLFHILTK